MFFHIVSIVMCLYIRIIPYWLFLSYLIYLWFCFQSVIFSEKLLRNTKMLSKGSCFFSQIKAWFSEILSSFSRKSWFLLENLDSFPNKEQSWAMSISVYSVFLCLLFFETECILYYYIYIIYNIKNILSISK